MRVFHRTSDGAASMILGEGFQDRDCKYISDLAWEGVCVSDQLDMGGASDDEVFLALEIRDDVFAKYEWGEMDGRRESLIPASVLNRYGQPIVISATDKRIVRRLKACVRLAQRAWATFRAARSRSNRGCDACQPSPNVD